jgi:RNA recognition motif-containing protein
MNIYIGNLPYSASEEDLSEIFAKYGEVTTTKIILDRETGRSRGFGFVEMSDSAARNAIAELNGAELEGKQITVNEAQPKKTGFNRGGGGGNRGGGGGNRDYQDRRKSW